MKIATAQQTLSSSHLALEHREVSERLRTWVGARPPRETDSARNPETASPALVNISAMGRALAQQAAQIPPSPPPRPSVENPETSALSAAMENVDKDPAIAMLRNMLERVFGIKIKTFDSADLSTDTSVSEDLQKIERNATFGNRSGTPADNADWGMEYEYHEQRTEIETTRFAAEGIIKTEDGKSFEFKLSLEMTRSYSERIDVAFQAGNAARQKDPLMFNFAGNAAQLANQRFEIDLDNDGTLENARFAAQGSGFLVFDKNEDGKINSGKEMFGPSTGDGFGELAVHDSDQNGWIDENDPIFAQLKVWTKTAEGSDVLRTLKESNVGAISLGRLATPFSIKDADNSLMGQVRSSSVYLTDDGKAGTVQQVDLAV